MNLDDRQVALLCLWEEFIRLRIDIVRLWEVSRDPRSGWVYSAIIEKEERSGIVREKIRIMELSARWPLVSTLGIYGWPK